MNVYCLIKRLCGEKDPRRQVEFLIRDGDGWKKARLRNITFGRPTGEKEWPVCIMVEEGE